MAYMSKISFNGKDVELEGVKWNGSTFSECKGILLNGELLVDFSYEPFDQTEYKQYYNRAFNGDSVEAQKYMSKKIAENEFVITSSRYLLYTRQDLIDQVGTDINLFTINGDGRLLFKNDAQPTWEMLKGVGVENIVFAGVSSGYFTGLPLVFKDNNREFQATKILNNALDNISKIRDGYQLNFDNSNDNGGVGRYEIKNYYGETLTVEMIVNAIEQTFGFSVTSYSNTEIIMTGENIGKWGTFEFLNALSHVSLDGFGPYGLATEYQIDVNPNFTGDELYCNISSDYLLPIKMKSLDYYDTAGDIGCDFYILTGYSNTYLPGEIRQSTDGSGILQLDGYYMDGENNPCIHIYYFDTSCFAGLKYPNILCPLSCVYNSDYCQVIYDNGDPTHPKWVGVSQDSFGTQSVSLVIPDGPFTDNISDVYADTINLPSIETWIKINGLANSNVSCELDSTYATLVADEVLQYYMDNYINYFPRNTVKNPEKIVTYKLRLSSRDYPSYASGSIGNIDEETSYWYLDAYDPYNVGGYYPVERTTGAEAGTRYNAIIDI